MFTLQLAIQAQAGLSKSYKTNFSSSGFYKYANNFFIRVLKYVFAISYDIKLYNYEVKGQTMAKNSSLLQES